MKNTTYAQIVARAQAYVQSEGRGAIAKITTASGLTRGTVAKLVDGGKVASHSAARVNDALNSLAASAVESPERANSTASPVDILAHDLRNLADSVSALGPGETYLAGRVLSGLKTLADALPNLERMIREAVGARTGNSR
jgi:hypothetical protein